MNVKAPKLKQFFENTLEIHTDQNIFKFKNYQMLHSHYYANNNKYGASLNLIEKFFSWIADLSDKYTNEVLEEIKHYFPQSNLMQHATLCFDPIGFVIFFLF